MAKWVAYRWPLLRKLARQLRRQTFDEVAAVHRALAGQGGVLVDVGAHSGTSLAAYAADGWRVIAVEPDPKNRRRLIERFGGSDNVQIVDRAISEEDGVRLPLYTSGISTGISTLAPFHPTHRPTTLVDTVRLDTLLADIDRVTVLKVDTEGWDLFVLHTFPWGRLSPRAVICEFEDRKTAPLGYRYEDLADFLQAKGYTVLTSEWHPVVEYGQQHRWRRIVRYPAKLLNGRAWGNLIAVDEETADSILRTASRRWFRQ